MLYKMNKLDAFAILMDTLFEFTSVSGVNQNIPRTYGTDDILYMAEVHLLRDIQNEGETTITQLANSHRKSKSSMTQLVNKLEQKGLITKEKVVGSRNVMVKATEKGKYVTKFHNELDLFEYSKILTLLPDFSEDEFERITQLIRIIIDGSRQAIIDKRNIL